MKEDKVIMTALLIYTAAGTLLGGLGTTAALLHGYDITKESIFAYLNIGVTPFIAGLLCTLSFYITCAICFVILGILWGEKA